MSVSQYLERYAQPEARLAVQARGERWQWVVVVPCCDELDGAPRLLESLRRAAVAGGGRALAVLVINSGEGAKPEVYKANQQLLAELGGEGLQRGVAALDLWLVDRDSPGRRIPVAEGVGLARKLGCDLALALIDAGAVEVPWLWTTDGDAEVPEDYFAAVLGDDESTAITLPFAHLPTEDHPRAPVAIRLYDLSLRYYVAGLRYAGSAWSYYSIGSTLVLRADAYAKVRGFPRRAAGEDFHLLAKLAKLGPVSCAAGSPILLQGRVSHRVPFGTGAAVAKLVEEPDPELSFRLYDPRSFSELAAWLACCAELVQSQRAAELLPALEGVSSIPAGLLAVLVDELGLSQSVWSACESSARLEVRQRHLHSRLDALWTLRFIHRLRDRIWPELPWQQALQQAPFAVRAEGGG
ncbi:MAG: hypothetical protein CMP23_06210 [Rickettsiales bacterium]|nr:hypothetical protein [Rickettsiales bacterium]